MSISMIFGLSAAASFLCGCILGYLYGAARMRIQLTMGLDNLMKAGRIRVRNERGKRV